MRSRSDYTKVISYALIGYGLMNLLGAVLRFGGMRHYLADFLFLKNPEALVEFARYVEALLALISGILLLRRPGRAPAIILMLTIVSACKIGFAIREGITQAQRAGRTIDEAAYGAFISWFALPVIGIMTLLAVRRIRAGESLPHCESCGYDLRRLNEPRCPECGRVYTLDEFYQL